MTAAGRIPLNDGLWAIVDLDWVEYLRKFEWRARRHRSNLYAVTTILRDGKRKILRMHRLITNTPRGMVCHHKNHITLDNRTENLENMTKQKHNELHGRSYITIKYG